MEEKYDGRFYRHGRVLKEEIMKRSMSDWQEEQYEKEYGIRGPFYWGVLKDGDVRYFENKPKRPHVEEHIEV